MMVIVEAPKGKVMQRSFGPKVKCGPHYGAAAKERLAIVHSWNDDRSGAEKCSPGDSEYVWAAPQLRTCFLFRYGIWFSAPTLRLLYSLLYIWNNNNYSQSVFKAGEVPRWATTYKKLAGHGLFVVLIANSLFPVYFPLPFQRLKLHLDRYHTLTRERLLEVEVNRSKRS
jgi:hypothetical protein